MARSLAIALVVVSPFAWTWWRRVRARRSAAAETTATTAVDPGPSAPALEDVIEEINALGEHRGRHDGSDAATITVPHGVTIDGDPAPPAVVDAIVRDALQRSGFVATAEIDTGESRVIEIRLRADR